MKNRNCLPEIADIILTKVSNHIQSKFGILLSDETINEVLHSFTYIDVFSDIKITKANKHKIILEINKTLEIQELRIGFNHNKFISKFDIITFVYEFIISNPSTYKIFKLTGKTH